MDVQVLYVECVGMPPDDDDDDDDHAAAICHCLSGGGHAPRTARRN